MPSTHLLQDSGGWIPPYDATPVALLRAVTFVPLGKTNMDEFAMGSSTEHSLRADEEPVGLGRIPGGSGGGSLLWSPHSAAACAGFRHGGRFASRPQSRARSSSPTVGFAVRSRWRRRRPWVLVSHGSGCGTAHDVIGKYDRDSTSLKDEWPSLAVAAREGHARVAQGCVSASELDTASRRVSRSVSSEALSAADSERAEIVEVSTPLRVRGGRLLILPPRHPATCQFDWCGLLCKSCGRRSRRMMAATREAGFRPGERRIIPARTPSALGIDAHY